MRYLRRLQPSAAKLPVILVGHSMGGVVARAVPLRPSVPTGTVVAILTLATPHAAPPWACTAGLTRMYADLDAAWRSRSGAAAGIALASLAGGVRDVQVPEYLTSVAGLGNHSLGLSAADLVGAAVSADHQAIVWCNQIVSVSVDALLAVAAVLQAEALTAASSVNGTSGLGEDGPAAMAPSMERGRACAAAFAAHLRVAEPAEGSTAGGEAARSAEAARRRGAALAMAAARAALPACAALSGRLHVRVRADGTSPALHLRLHSNPRRVCSNPRAFMFGRETHEPVQSALS